MTFKTERPDGAQPLANTPADIVEIVSPLPETMRVLARLVQDVPGSLSGASIATAENGNLLLNGYAWELFGDELQKEIPTLRVVMRARGAAKPLRFLLYGNGLSD